MRKIILTTVLATALTATIAIAGGHSSAEDGEKKHKKWGGSEYSEMHGKKMHMMKKCFGGEYEKSEHSDNNEKGFNIAEHTQKMKQHHEKMLSNLKMADTDGDGFLSKEEMRSKCGGKKDK